MAIALPCAVNPLRPGLPWADLGVDLVLECTGSFSDRATAEGHFAQWRHPKFCFPSLQRPMSIWTVVCGINQADLRASHQIVSNASCTTNCIVPVITYWIGHFGVTKGVMTTIHSAMNDQPVIDAYHHRIYAIPAVPKASPVPVNTELARGIERVLPHLHGKLQAKMQSGCH